MNDRMKAFRQMGAKLGHRLKELFHKSEDPLIRGRQRLLAHAGIALLVCLVVIGVGFGMTAAWYTNVVESGAMTVRADTWGFRGEVTGTEQGITARPGDSGTLGQVSITNGDDRAARVRLDVLKSSDLEMQKRLYCYTQSEGETTWLNSESAAYFDLAAGENASHSLEDVHWLWVYDLLGYYVLATTDGETVTVEEYLSPVEYDLDTATFDAEGKLATVETDAGTLNARQYIAALGGNSEVSYGGYTFVRNEGGKLVLLYLLTLDEIQAAAEYDTRLGTGEATSDFSLTLRFTAQNARPTESEQALSGD